MTELAEGKVKGLVDALVDSLSHARKLAGWTPIEWYCEWHKRVTHGAEPCCSRAQARAWKRPPNCQATATSGQPDPAPDGGNGPLSDHV